MTVISPLTNKDICIKESNLDFIEIIQIYKKQFNLDISDYFKNIKELSIYRCPKTGYKFYYPFNVSGDELYYSMMSKFEWYYNPNRWEHIKSLEIIKNKYYNVLEIGSGPGYFLKKLKEINIKAVGLELNNSAILQSKEFGVKVLSESIEEHKINNIDKYDLVCSFQVLEHISQPYSFIKASIDVLKKGGTLLIAVPNNDSYSSKNKHYSKVLNMPPHHMGLWTIDSLISLESIFNIKFKRVYYEPLIGSNVDIYIYNMILNIFKLEIINRIIWKLKLHIIFRIILKLFRNHIKGNSMIVIFEKV
jgi:SAM-dependent methyltransferase